MPRINLKLNRRTGLGTLECVGGSIFNCGGMVDYAYPADTTVTTADKKGTVISQTYLDSSTGQPARMDFSILWIGQDGVYIHAWSQLPGSHGCIHLLPSDAQALYTWLTASTRIVFTWTD